MVCLLETSVCLVCLAWVPHAASASLAVACTVRPRRVCLHCSVSSPVKTSFPRSVSLPIEMTSSVITVKNATTEYSGTYKCTVSNRVGSDQCVLRLDVVPRKYLPSGVITFAPLVFMQRRQFSQQGGIEGKWMQTVSRARCGLLGSFPESRKEKNYILLEKPSLL